MAIAGAAIAGAASLFGGAMANQEKQAAREQAARAYGESVKDLENIGIPSIEAQQIVMKQYQDEGQWTPELAETIKLGDSNLGGISLDPRYKEAEMGALNKLTEIGASGGRTLSDKAALEKDLANIDADQRGRRGAILQDAQERGGYGSGTSLVAQLMAQQEGAGAARQVSLNSAATAEQRALDAIIKGGSLASSLRGEEYGEKAAAAKAQDEIAKWNAQNSQGVVNQNLGLKNDASRYNLDKKQNLSNANTDIVNKQEVYNKGLIQDNFTNKLNVNTAKANARAGQATTAIQGGKDAAEMWQGVGSGIAKAGTAAGQYAAENEKKEKEEV